MKSIRNAAQVLLCLTVLHVINGLPLESDEGIGNSIDEGEILSVSTIINGIRREEIPDLLEQIAKVRTTIKTQAFDTLMTEVAYNGVSLEHTKTIIDVVKKVLDESLDGLDEVRRRVESISVSNKPLTEEESLFLSNVRQAIPDILEFTANEFQLISEMFRASLS